MTFTEHNFVLKKKAVLKIGPSQVSNAQCMPLVYDTSVSWGEEGSTCMCSGCRFEPEPTIRKWRIQEDK